MKKKLKLNELKVQSFVTNLNNQDKVMGGDLSLMQSQCNTCIPQSEGMCLNTRTNCPIIVASLDPRQSCVLLQSIPC